MKSWVEKIWYGNIRPFRKRSNAIAWLLWPISLVYQGIVFLRRSCLTRFYQRSFAVPVVVVGNLSVGGVGKTPFVIALVNEAQKKGLRVGVVSRGYGACIKDFPHEVDEQQDTAQQVGDEPLLIARKAGCPVVIAPKRVDAVEYLLAKYACQLIISDDGLQHYRMGRAVEIAIVDGNRLFGNGFSLPAGPLREPRARLDEVDFVVVNGGRMSSIPKAYSMHLAPKACKPLHGNGTIAWDALPRPIAAIAGIGHPDRFFESLRTLGLDFTPYSFPDHYRFRESHITFKERSLIMTEKDAVKCQSFTRENCYVLPVEAILHSDFWQAFWSHEELRGLFT